MPTYIVALLFRDPGKEEGALAINAIIAPNAAMAGSQLAVQFIRQTGIPQMLTGVEVQELTPIAWPVLVNLANSASNRSVSGPSPHQPERSTEAKNVADQIREVIATGSQLSE